MLKDPNKNPVIKNLSEGLSLDEYFSNSNYQTSNKADDGFSVFENYPYALGEDLHYKLCLSAFTNWELDSTLLREGTRILRIEDCVVDGKKTESTIQFFNGETK